MFGYYIFVMTPQICSALPTRYPRLLLSLRYNTPIGVLTELEQ
jgi:hypothetical protein